MTRDRRRTPVRFLVALAAALGTVACLLGAPAHAASAGSTAVAADEPPRVTGAPVFRSRVVADPGTWAPRGATYTYRWLRGGKPIHKAWGKRYRPRLRDIGRNLAVRVTARVDGETRRARSAPVRVRRARLVPKRRPHVGGVRRYTRRLSADKGRWNVRPQRFRFRWLRNGRPIKGAWGPRYRLSHRDVGKRVRVRVTARRAGYRKRIVFSRPKRILHRVPQRRVVHYSVETRGRINASVRKFRRMANATLNDPRGWRGAAGVTFKEVRSSSAMRLVLAEASTVPSFSSGCSSQWSCRVGRYVIINQMRWNHASPAWKRYGGSLRGYRHMVVGHETGHWLGWGHRSCPRRGARAPLMQQQSISLQGCRFNPWPTPAERNVPRF